MPDQPDPTAKPATEERPAPPTKSFAEIAREGAPAPSIATPAAPADDFNEDDFISRIPERSTIRQTLIDSKGKLTRKQLADILAEREGIFDSVGQFMAPVMPLLNEASKDPKIMERLGKLADPRAREFVLDRALDIYERDYREPGAPKAGEPGSAEHAAETGAPKIIVDRLEKLEKSFEADNNARAQAAYEAARTQEYKALSAEAPELAMSGDAERDKIAYARAKHIIDWAEQQSQKTGKRVSYKQAYETWKETVGTSAPMAVPNLSPSGIPAPKREYKTTDEAKSAAVADLAKIGGFARLARVRSN